MVCRKQADLVNKLSIAGVAVVEFYLIARVTIDMLDELLAILELYVVFTHIDKQLAVISDIEKNPGTLLNQRYLSWSFNDFNHYVYRKYYIGRFFNHRRTIKSVFARK
jgi:hypothetical protein